MWSEAKPQLYRNEHRLEDISPHSRHRHDRRLSRLGLSTQDLLSSAFMPVLNPVRTWFCRASKSGIPILPLEPGREVLLW